MTKSELKLTMAHYKRMETRLDIQLPFNTIDNYIGMSPTFDHLIAFIHHVAATFKTTDVKFGAIELPQYYNDTFKGDGKPWWQDIGPIFKVALELEIGVLHFYIHNGQIVLDLIMAHNKGQGHGTAMLNTVLDTADDLGIDIHTYPCDTNPTTLSMTMAKTRTLKLRKWFSEFDFTSHKLTAKMTYKSKKNS